MSQFDKDDVEAIGLVKFDFLGLATLTILELAKDFIVARHPGQRRLRLREHAARRRARSTGCSPKARPRRCSSSKARGMQAHAARRASRRRLEDLIALNAMFRPGPDGPHPELRARASTAARRWSIRIRCSRRVLGETYGIMVYQEQVMQAAQVLGGYSLGGADLLRRAMGKKKAEEMAKHREIFREGAAKNGIGAAKADEVFDLMEKFAGYGFNKSHAAAYSLLAYHTAWLKVHYTAEFFAANMTVEIDDTDKLKVLLDDARRTSASTLRAARRQPRHLPLRAGRRQGDPLRPRRGQGHGPGRDRGDRRGARGGRAVHAACSTSARASTASASTSAWSRR